MRLSRGGVDEKAAMWVQEGREGRVLDILQVVVACAKRGRTTVRPIIGCGRHVRTGHAHMTTIQRRLREVRVEYGYRGVPSLRSLGAC